MRKGMMCSIYRSATMGDCSNNGLSSLVNSVTLRGTNVPEIIEPNMDRPPVILRTSNGGHVYAVPEAWGVKPGATGPMFGGTFVYVADPKFPTGRPIPLHDRYEVEQKEPPPLTLTYGVAPDPAVIIARINSIAYHLGNIHRMPEVVMATNQGIDSHLAAIEFEQVGQDVFIKKESMPVLIRRLIEKGTDESLDFASCVLSTLNIEWI